jgi:hypothetical protein
MPDPFILHYTPYMTGHAEDPAMPRTVTITATSAHEAKVIFMASAVAVALLETWDEILVWSIQRQAASARLRAWNEPYWRDGGFPETSL